MKEPTVQIISWQTKQRPTNMVFSAIWVCLKKVIWRFPEMGVPPNNPCYFRIFHEINNLFCGTSTYGNPRIPESLGWSFPIQIAITCRELGSSSSGNETMCWTQILNGALDTVHWCWWFKVAFYTYIYDYICILYKPTLCKLYLYNYVYICIYIYIHI